MQIARISVFATAAVVGACSSTPDDDPGSENCSADGSGYDADYQKFECRVFDAVNERRAAGATCGSTSMAATRPLTMHDTLRSLARGHAVDMNERGYFAHDSPEGKSPFDRMTEAGYRYSTAAENIAQGAPSPEVAVDTWMTSGGHCQNIMNPAFEHLGVGYAFGSTHLWVQTFGATR